MFSSIPELQKVYHIHKGFIFLDTMADNGRLSKLTDVINLYLELMSAHRGEVICKVTTAKVSIFKQVQSFMKYHSELLVNFLWTSFFEIGNKKSFEYMWILHIEPTEIEQLCKNMYKTMLGPWG